MKQELQPGGANQAWVWLGETSQGGEDAGVWTLVFGRWPAYGPLVLSGPTGSACVSVFFFWVLVGGAWGTSRLM